VTVVGRHSDPDLPDSLRHLFDGAADPTPRAPADIDLTDDDESDSADENASTRDS
jgi:hypothetical protein